MKKLVLTALICAFASSTYAQSNVTISGFFKGSVDQFSISNPNSGRTGPNSENRVSDHASRILFNVSEDLGGGMRAIGQYDLRFRVDQQVRVSPEASAASSGHTQNVSATADPLSTGNIHVGLAHKDYGTIRLGRQDVYWNENSSFAPGTAHLAAQPQPLFHSLATANAARTPNLVWYESPRLNGIQATVGYSTNPLRASGTVDVENDLSTNNRRSGGGTYFKLNSRDVLAKGLDLTYATINYKSDYAGGNSAYSTWVFDTVNNAQADQRGHTLVAKYKLPKGFSIGAGYSTEQQVTVATGAVTKRDAWMVSGGYAVGVHTFAVDYVVANDTKNGAGAVSAGTGAKSYAFNYQYALSKRTAVGLTYTVLDNDANSRIGPYFQGNNAFGGQFTALNGETYKVTSAILRHSF